MQTWFTGDAVLRPEEGLCLEVTSMAGRDPEPIFLLQRNMDCSRKAETAILPAENSSLEGMG